MSPSSAITELSRMTPTELRKELFLKRTEAAKMRLGLEMQAEKNHAAYRVLKKEIARMTMVLHTMQKNGKTETSAEMPSKATKNTVKDTGSKKSASKPTAKKATKKAE